MTTTELKKVVLQDGRGTIDGHPVFFAFEVERVSVMEFVKYMNIAMSAYRYCEGLIYISPN